ncbi:MAG: hypothetical protein IT535_01690 [Bauldia sp.]|nr:hypothetical protein [Bauldia sp.]
MRKLALLAATSAVLLTPIAASAAADEAYGWITSFDGARLTILGDDTVYLVPGSLDVSDVRTQRIVHFSYEISGGVPVVTSLDVSAPAPAPEGDVDEPWASGDDS